MAHHARSAPLCSSCDPPCVPPAAAALTHKTRAPFSANALLSLAARLTECLPGRAPPTLIFAGVSRSKGDALPEYQVHVPGVPGYRGTLGTRGTTTSTTTSSSPTINTSKREVENEENEENFRCAAAVFGAGLQMVLAKTRSEQKFSCADQPC
eukprot:894765-Rhodomonas_salina.1